MMKQSLLNQTDTDYEDTIQVLHTLGPSSTDSSAAAEYYVKNQAPDAEIQLHHSYEEILAHLSDYSGEHLLIPAAFQSRQLHETWGDIHYCELSTLNLLTSFTTQLDELLLVENQNATNHIAYTHAATAKLLTQNLETVTIKTAVSKYQAYQNYRQNQARYVLTNAKNLEMQANDQILRTWHPKMVWCLYEIL
ncbi:amino acid biosynthesis protein [Agrilactobacillus yilanensis]|uniref:Amino acid biosynthesis protein n=1 Tax=Agrilactobacillus yilanensis TaxID=2485997 RepID=A0ABW4J7R3_9LACO|nr:amino acid biosynthesis protein [Agrilactobacillus yilanensis]